MPNLDIVVRYRSSYIETYKTLRNIQMLGNACGMKTQVYLLITIVDKETSRIKKKAKELFNNIQIPGETFSDFSEIKEYVIRTCKGEFVLFIDSGDLLSLSTFKNFRNICNPSKEWIYLTEKKVFFEEEYYTEDNIESSSNLFTPFSFLIQDKWNSNPWGSTFIASKKILERIEQPQPNHESKIANGIAAFFCNCLSNGINFVIIPQAISFYRKNKDSIDNFGDYVLPKLELFAPKKSTKNKLEAIMKESIQGGDYEKNILLIKSPKLYKGLSHCRAIWQEITDKEDKRSILKKVPSTLFPKLYLRIFACKERFLKILGKKSNKQYYPLWFVDEWKQMNSIEPMLFPPENQIYEKKLSTNTNLEKYLQELYSHFPSTLDYLIVCPWLKRGGADKLAINLIKGIKKIFPHKTVGLLLTEQSDSEKSMLPKDVYFFDYGNSFKDLSVFEKETLLLRFFIQNPARKIININSHSFFNILLKYSKPLSFYAKIYCFCFSPSKASSGQLTGFSFNFIPNIIDDLEMVITDNTNIIDILVDMFGLDRKKFFVLYQPVEILEHSKKEYSGKREWKILWASRIDYEKLPNVLERIISISPKEEISFHIYGNSLLDKQFPLKKFNKHKNAFTYGVYSGGLPGIEHSKYDLFLYTSEFDGMPNTVLEALSLGIPVISSNVGGIKEVIENGVTGFLVDDIYDEKKYLELIKKMIGGGIDLNKIRSNANKKLQEQHSWEVYLDRLKKVLV